MKSVFVSAAILCFSMVTMAQSVNLEGRFESSVRVGKAVDQKRVSIRQNAAGNFDIAISNGIGENACIYNGEAKMLNRVQLVSQINDCQVTVGFTSPQTVSVWTDGFCSADCSIKMDDVKRVEYRHHGKKKK